MITMELTRIHDSNRIHEGTKLMNELGIVVVRTELGIVVVSTIMELHELFVRILGCLEIINGLYIIYIYSLYFFKRWPFPYDLMTSNL